ncbi:Transposase, Mutator family [Desulfitobacterium hafniense]|uniref:Transposase, Mutator family n=1 Tax=Desulfitobacterium hafniense TaxID=49338 RepID=A0A098B5J2_DESHA|nr:Transposase, Mutator family [Desulfitobacterium hafniense]
MNQPEYKSLPPSQIVPMLADKGIYNVIERLNREIRRRTRVVGTFPDGNSALMLVCARLRHVASKAWGTKPYMSMKHLEEMKKETQQDAG